jgi:hypothetical protein
MKVSTNEQLRISLSIRISMDGIDGQGIGKRVARLEGFGV